MTFLCGISICLFQMTNISLKRSNHEDYYISNQIYFQLNLLYVLFIPSQDHFLRKHLNHQYYYFTIIPIPLGNRVYYLYQLSYITSLSYYYITLYLYYNCIYSSIIIYIHAYVSILLSILSVLLLVYFFYLAISNLTTG